MKGWCISQDMLYIAPQNIEKIVQKEEYGQCYRSIKRSKINFQFNKEDYINLADLLYLLKINVDGIDCQFTQLYRGQILLIMKMIAVHLLKIHVCELIHNNLEPKNIWIKVGQSKLMTCFIDQIDFEKVHFVNYKVSKLNEELSQSEDYNQLKDVLGKLVPFLIMKDGQMVYDCSLHQGKTDDQIPEQIQQQINQINNQQTLNNFIQYLELYYLNPPQQKGLFSKAMSLVVPQKEAQKLQKDFTFSKLANRYRNASQLCVAIEDLNTEFVQGQEKFQLDSAFQNSIYNYAYIDKFQLVAKDLTENYFLTCEAAINQKAKKIIEELAKIFDHHIIKSFDNEIEKSLQTFQEEVEKQFSSEFKIKIDMKDFTNKEEYIDQWKLWLQNEIGNDFHQLQHLNFEDVNAKILKNTKKNYLDEHKRLLHIELQKLINELQ